MVLRRILPVFCFLLIAATSSWAGDFDCAKPAYGRPLDTMNDHNYLVKYKEGNGIVYYTYTGPCRIGVYKRLEPIIAYGVVDGKLYSRVMKTENDDIDIIKKVTTRLAGTPQTVTEGDWLIMSWDFPEKKMKMKLKYNNTSKATKSAIYYEPLRPREFSASEEGLEK